MSAFLELLDLLLPTRCVLCSILGSPVCLTCSQRLITNPRPVSRGPLLGLAATKYGVLEHDLIKAFKEDGQTGTLPALAGPLVALLRQMTLNSRDTLLVPMPSSRANFAKRGYQPATLIARRVNSLAGKPCRLVPALRFQRAVADQTHLNARARHLNLDGAMVANPVVDGRQVILFDDIVTTGATILEGARAVGMAGGEVLGFLTFSETILKTQTKT